MSQHLGLGSHSPLGFVHEIRNLWRRFDILLQNTVLSVKAIQILLEEVKNPNFRATNFTEGGTKEKRCHKPTTLRGDILSEHQRP